MKQSRTASLVPDGAIGTEMICNFYPFYAACFCNYFGLILKTAFTLFL
jgi:hypothetical protein